MTNCLTMELVMFDIIAKFLQCTPPALMHLQSTSVEGLSWTPHCWSFEGANPARFGTDIAHFWCTGRALTIIVSVVILPRGGLDHRHGVRFFLGA